MAQNNKKSFAKWLEILQQESWQLELLISGFAIFLLASAYDPLVQLNYDLRLLTMGGSYYGALFLPLQIAVGTWYVLIINLILHVLLRGLWISTIGLRYVSDEIDFDSLNFSPKFDQFLRRKIVSFDNYIERLESLCSIVFGFTFLIIFILISIGFYVMGIILISLAINAVQDYYSSGWLGLLIPILLIYIIGGVIYFFDFMTLGWFKRNKSIGKIYYPIYRFYNFVTLSFIYRPIYYNLIDNRYGKKVVLFLIPYLFIFALFTSMRVEPHGYLPGRRTMQSINNNFYDDTWDRSEFLGEASIGSRYVKNAYIELFLPYFGRSDDEVIAKICPELTPAKKGVFIFRTDFKERLEMDGDEALACHAKRFEIFVNDSLINDPKYRFYQHPERKNIGLLTVLDVDYLDRGEYEIKINALQKKRQDGKDTIVMQHNKTIPFWKE
ncbi:hypothetical protein LCM02_05055 [Lutimonas saemankumensis]|uniref:hypothetical protein n=1 Tax=Lutimonas saemankumensis TaxID=483016 RepID=UPI001CD67CDA|nr:hypothetical protein [Lutimonas saemankumensis]MCA0931811.1 hypothetical protein [Lutimonas saemankumensis]